MILSGVFVNTIAIALGGLFGTFFKKGVSQRLNRSLMQGLALCVLYIGVRGTLQGKNIVIAILSVIIGAILGEIFDFNQKLQSFGDYIQGKLPAQKTGSSIAESFVTSTLFVCVGAMAIVGSLQSGLTGSHETLYAKALIDGIVAIVMASTMGIGVSLSAVSVLVYESVLTLSAHAISSCLTTTVINEMTCVGSLLIIAIALNMLKLTNIKVANFVIAPFIPIGLCMILR
ncbi:MAG TPA: DUF554 domain-containing protein [Clostridia bacterium]|nr:DUF554 domain-containing protein [Clostridia bacterium]